MTRILIIGGGYAGFYTAKKLEKTLRKGEAEVTLVDPLPYMTYQPFLPEVAAGEIEARHILVSHRRHLPHTKIVQAKVTAISAADKKVTVQPELGDAYDIEFDQLVVTLGSVSRTFPTPGVADNAIGFKSIQEAVGVRDTLIDNFNKAANLEPGALRDKLLTVTVVGGGFAGIEAFAELRSLATYLLKFYPTISFDDIHFHLIEAAPGIMPEVSKETSKWVLANLNHRNATVHLNTLLLDATDGHCVAKTSIKDKDGKLAEPEKTIEFDSDLIIWTAGVMANPVLKKSDLPLEPRGRLRVRADLRVEGDDGIVEGIWGAGDSCQVPDLSGSGLPFDGSCVPNAQHAVRQAKRLAKNLVATLRGEEPIDYVHKPQGAVAGLGPGRGVYTGGQKKFAIKGWLAWFMHRGYHGFAMPTWERKLRIFTDWCEQLFIRRDVVTTIEARTPRAFFEEYATRPKPKPAEVPEPKPAEAQKQDATEAPKAEAEKTETSAAAEGASAEEESATK